MRSTLLYLHTFSCKHNGPSSQACDQPGLLLPPSGMDTNGSPPESTSEMTSMSSSFLCTAADPPDLLVASLDYCNRCWSLPAAVQSFLITVARVTFLDTDMTMSLPHLKPLLVGSILSLDQVQTH